MLALHTAPPAPPAPDVDEREWMRRTVFLTDDSVVLCMTVWALEEIGVLSPSLKRVLSVEELYPDIGGGGFGYLRAGLRTLAGQGWLADAPTLDPGTSVLRWTDVGRAVMARRADYASVGSFLAGFSSNAEDAWREPWGEDHKVRFAELSRACAGECLDLSGELTSGLREASLTHLNLALAVPVLLWLSASGRLTGSGPDLAGDEAGSAARLLMQALGWLDERGQWTSAGAHARDYSDHFGIVGSYLPMLSRLPELYRGERVVRQPSDGSVEWHVNRTLNVRASAAAHGRYFADADEIFLDIFDRQPLERQPRYVADTGCGDGSWLASVFELVRRRTVRGANLDRFPLTMVGVDASHEALEEMSRVLAAREVPGVAVHGDIGDPDAIAEALAGLGLAMEDGLHIRAFVDHDRAYRGAGGPAPAETPPTGAYVDDEGRALSGEQVERDLVAHLERWTPHVRRHGLVVLEAHCVAPAIARQHLGALHSVAFDAYHAYSHQYPVEHSSYVACCRQAGFERLAHAERHYPTRRPFITVSLNRLMPVEALDRLEFAGLPARRRDGEGEWRPDPKIDRSDGEGLHRLLFEVGDPRRQRLWCLAATGALVRSALAHLDTRFESAGRGEVVRVLDYGTGTGLAAIALLSALRERGLEERLRESGVRFELHLVDLPSGWFAKAHDLLAPCPWVRFHALRGPNGFRPLDEILDGRRVDLAIASMVFHLLPSPALSRVATELSGVLAADGALVWNSPDLGPPAPDTVLFHDASRACRARWLERNADGLDPEVLRMGNERAARRILPEANSTAAVAGAFSGLLDGAIDARAHEMTATEVLDALLVPSNQAEYLSEVPEPDVRERVIRSIMGSEVIPRLQASAAGTHAGVSIQWVSGFHRRAG